MVNTVKGLEELEGDDALGEEEFSTGHCLPSRGAGSWSTGLAVKVCSSLRFFLYIFRSLMVTCFKNDCGYFLFFFSLVQAKNRIICNSKRDEVYLLKEILSANASGQCFGFVSVPFLQPGKVM